MNIFETVKAAVPVRQAAEHYGLKVNRNGMACCPFHNDRHPSLKLNEEYFFCFGCGATGDVIDFAARLFDLSSYEAAQRLAADFGISTEQGQAVAAPRKPKHPHTRQFREDEMHCFRVLTDYLHLLEDWKVWYAPKTPADDLDDRFVEACQMLDRLEYLTDIGTFGLDHSYGSGRFRVKPKIRSQLLCCFIAAQIEQPCRKVNHIPGSPAAEAEEIILIQL